MARDYYVAQHVVHPKLLDEAGEPKEGAMIFHTNHEQKARSEALIDPHKRSLLVYDGIELVESTRPSDLTAEETRQFDFVALRVKLKQQQRVEAYAIQDANQASGE